MAINIMKKTTLIAIALLLLIIMITNAIFNKDKSSGYIIGICAGLCFGRILAEII
jgi:hypothetical protein